MRKTHILLHVEEAAFILAKKFPQLRRCQDYWVAHPVDEKTLEQTKSAWVPFWAPQDMPCPTPNDLLTWWPDYKDEYALIAASESVRRKRDDLLAQADLMVEQAADAGKTELESALRQYRQALRAIPEQAGFPLHVVWPELPKVE